ncbi:SH3 domain-containing protein [Agrobacterium cavarae]|uniref:SH3 domain-containing protein n=1 Tax=Agrobacterium cavarae TaxID=2528239 RepID=UPI0028A7B8AC|nr:SH3 domain-containing protein [Agrobacterium cavarae]
MFVKRFLVGAAIAALLFPAGATALTFSTEPIDATKSVILVSGVFEPSESLSPFVSLAKGLGTRSGIVVFNSIGGNPSKAIELGRLIRALGLPTFQMRGMECSFASALAFMGGTVRFAETGSIGVHKTSFAETSAISVDDAVSYIQHQTAETIGYMTEMGIDPSLLQLSQRYEKDDMRYLSKSEMQQYRVTTLGNVPPPPETEVSANTQPSASETAALPAYRIAEDDPRFQIPLAKTGKIRVPKGKEFLRAGEDQKSEKLISLRNGDKVDILAVGDRWYLVRTKGKEGYVHHNWVKVDQFLSQPLDNRFIQIKSFDNFAEAAAYVRDSSLPVTAYLATNKWFAVALMRSLPPDEAAGLLKDLKDKGSVPDDAFMTVGNTYVKSVCCSN